MWRYKYILLAFALLFAVARGSETAFCGFSEEYEVWTGGSSSAHMEVLTAEQYRRADARSIGGVSFETDESAEAILAALGARVVKEERAAGVTSYYARAEGLPYSLRLFGEQVNLQVAVREDGKVKVGCPVIFGSF